MLSSRAMFPSCWVLEMSLWFYSCKAKPCKGTTISVPLWPVTSCVLYFGHGASLALQSSLSNMHCVDRNPQRGCGFGQPSGSSKERRPWSMCSLSKHHARAPIAQACFAQPGSSLHLLPPCSNIGWWENCLQPQSCRVQAVPELCGHFPISWRRLCRPSPCWGAWPSLKGSRHGEGQVISRAALRGGSAQGIARVHLWDGSRGSLRARRGGSCRCCLA